MVSTRLNKPNKYKFSEGEKILCYEPDPQKSRILYIAKVSWKASIIIMPVKFFSKICTSHSISLKAVIANLLQRLTKILFDF